MMRSPKRQASDSQLPILGFKSYSSLSFGCWSLVILGLLLRLAPIGRYVTPDEPAWVYRAIRFADALAAHDWSAVPSTGHPGVTTMWLGVIGVTVQRWLTPAESTAHLDWIRRLAWLAPENGEAFRHMTFFLPLGRVAVALVTTLGLVILYLLLVRLFARRVALLTVGLLAFDPFLIGHSGLLHTDALLGTFTLLALVAALNEMREPHRAVWAALSGLFAGLALLTKTSALVVLPFVLLILAASHLRTSRISDLKSQLRCLPSILRRWALVILLTALTCFVLYPAFWAAPINTLGDMFSFAARLAETAPRPVFFAGQVTYEPGPTFYPVVFLFRISPAVLIGLIAGLAILRRLPSDGRLTFVLLLAFAVGFGALMSMGAKKHDRYLLPALLPLSPVAGISIAWYIGRLANLKTRQSTSPHLYQSTILVFQALIALSFALYPLTYANPLAGGPWVGARMLSTDWGEGMGAAARWLNQLPDADQLSVAASSVPSFAPLFNGRTLPLDQATQADYFVVGPKRSTNRLSSQPTNLQAYTATLGFLDHASVYSNAVPGHQSTFLATHAKPDDLILLDAPTPLLRHYDGPGNLISTADIPDRATVTTLLAKLSAGRSTLWLVADPAASPITAAHLRQALESIAAPVSTATVAGSTISQYASPKSQISNPESRISTFNDHLTLIDAVLPADPVNTPFPIHLRWQVLTPTPTDLRASLHLRDSDDHLWAEVGQLVLNDVAFPTSSWEPGQWADSVLTMKLPEYIPPGVYTVQLTVADSSSAQLGAWDANGQFQGVRVPLSDVEIAPPVEPAHLPLCVGGRALAADPFLVCVPELAPQMIPSGDVLTVALIWSSTAPPETDYRVRWRLLDATSSVALEQITDLSRYATSMWRKGESFEVRYDMRLNPTLPAARYTLVLNALAPNDQPLWDKDKALTTIEILPRDRLFELPPDIGHSLRLLLGSTVHLKGFNLNRTHAAPSDILPLTLYWQADGPADLDYTVFAHLVGPDGLVHGQVDQFPGGGAAPTTSWAPGQVIVDEISLPVAFDAPAGTYRIAVGMYDAASGGRLPIADASGRLLPNNQFILPLEITIAGDLQ